MTASRKILDDVSAKFSEFMAQSPARDFEKNARAALGSVFNKLDLVTREEFDVQSQVLLRTREKLTELELRVRSLEAKLAGGGAGSGPEAAGGLPPD